MKLRTFLYKLAKLIGDVSSVVNGRSGRRIRNRVVGRFLSRTFSSSRKKRR